MDHGNAFPLMFGKLLMQTTHAAVQDDGGYEVEVCALCCKESIPPHFKVKAMSTTV